MRNFLQILAIVAVIGMAFGLVAGLRGGLFEDVPSGGSAGGAGGEKVPETEEPQTYTVRGKYVFNETIEWTGAFAESDLTFDVTFGDYTKGYGLYAELNDHWVLGFGTPLFASLFEPIYQNGAWASGFVRIIDFGEDPQEISKECYDFLMQNGSFAPTYTVSGKYMFNETIVFPSEGFSEKISFGITYCGFTEATALEVLFEEDYCAVGYTIPGIDEISSEHVCVSYWYDRAVRIIDFGETPQEVSKVCYDFLEANGVFEKDCTLTGVYRFVDDPFAAVDAEWTIDVSFISNGGEYSKITLLRNGTDVDGNPQYYLNYDDVTVCYPTGWFEDEYKTLDFGSEIVYLSVDVYQSLIKILVPVT